MKKLLLPISTILLLSYCSNPDIKGEFFIFEPYELGFEPTTIGTEAFVLKEESFTACGTPPSQMDVNTGEFEFNDRLLTRSQAYKIGIPVANTSASYNFRIFVKDFRRYKTCRSSEDMFGSELMYGQVVRIVVEIEDYSASAGVDLASIAASGTINRNKQSLYIYTNGINNPQILPEIAKISGKPFNVENYAVYQNVMSSIISIIADPKTIFSVNLIGADIDLTDEADEELKKAPIISYALSQIQKTNSCNKCKERFSTNKDALALVENTYKSLNIPCNDDKPNEEAQVKAKKYLQGIKMRN